MLPDYAQKGNDFSQLDKTNFILFDIYVCRIFYSVVLTFVNAWFIRKIYKFSDILQEQLNFLQRLLTLFFFQWSWLSIGIRLTHVQPYSGTKFILVEN